MEDDKITKALATARLKDAKREGSDPQEIEALQQLIDLYDEETTAKKAVKDTQAALDRATLQKYGNLTEDEVKTLVLDDKWHTTIKGDVIGELDSLTFGLVARIQQLGERYNLKLKDLEAELANLDRRVTQHLADMGVQ